MIDFEFKYQFKIEGLNHTTRLEQDKCENEFESAIQRKMEMEKLRQQIKNRVFDPNHIECNLPDPQPTIDGISFDPEFITFNK